MSILTNEVKHLTYELHSSHFLTLHHIKAGLNMLIIWNTLRDGIC